MTFTTSSRVTIAGDHHAPTRCHRPGHLFDSSRDRTYSAHPITVARSGDSLLRGEKRIIHPMEELLTDDHFNPSH